MHQEDDYICTSSLHQAEIVLIEAPVLAYPDPFYPFLLDTDLMPLLWLQTLQYKRDSTEELHMAAYPPLRPATDEDTSPFV